MITETEVDKEIVDKIKDAINFLVPYFGINVADVLPFNIERFLGDMPQTKYQSEEFDIIIGKRAAHYLDFKSSGSCYKDILFKSSGLDIDVIEIIGHYGGLIYANRNNRSYQLFGLGAEAEGAVGEAYKLADKIFDSYRDFRLEEIVKIKNLTGRFNKIKELTEGVK